jgi:hypothetical protein
MSDLAPDAGVDQTATDVIEEAPDKGASLVPETNGDAPDAPQYPWSREHPEWTPDDAWKAYDEARTKISRGEHRQPEQPAQEEAPYDPYADLPAGDDPGTVETLGAIFAGQNAFQDGTYGPQAVLGWIAKNPDQLSAQTRGQFLLAWQQQDPWTAQQWVAQQTIQSEREQIRNELRREYAPAVQATTQTMNSTAISLAAQEIPDFEAWAPKVTQYLEQENPGALYGCQTAEQIADRICDITGMLASREQRNQRRTATAAPKPPPAAANTQTRSRASTSNEWDDHRAKVLEDLRTTRL